jgi:predicted NBD/HSP70 family sugar kinase
MTIEQIIETAIQGHASIRDAIRWAMQQERQACAKIADAFDPEMKMSNYGQVIANKIRARNDGCG